MASRVETGEAKERRSRRALFRLLLAARHGAEPDAAQRYAAGHYSRSIDGHRRADDVRRSRGNCRSPLSNVTRRQISTDADAIGIREFRDCRPRRKVRDVKSAILEQGPICTACHEPDVLRCATEVRAMKNRRHPCKSSTAIIEHAGKTIDEDFGIVDARRCWRDHS